MLGYLLLKLAHSYCTYNIYSAAHKNIVLFGLTCIKIDKATLFLEIKGVKSAVDFLTNSGDTLEWC